MPTDVTLKNYVSLAVRTECAYEPVLDRLLIAHSENKGSHSARTRASIKEALRLIHMSVGISGELSEFVEVYADWVENRYAKGSDDRLKKVSDEMGDILWYCAGVLDILGMSLKDSLEMTKIIKRTALGADIIAEMFVSSGRVAEQSKKAVFYGKPYDPETIRIETCSIVSSVDTLCEMSGLRFSNVIQSNIDKLRVRYPDRFSPDRAVTKDSDKESKAQKS